MRNINSNMSSAGGGVNEVDGGGLNTFAEDIEDFDNRNFRRITTFGNLYDFMKDTWIN